MTKSLWVFNVLLGLVAVVLLGLVVQLVLGLDTPDMEPQPAPTEPQAAVSAGEADVTPPAQRVFPSLEEFAAILRKDIFRNVLAETRVRPAVVQPPPPPLPPLPVLVGTLFVGEERKAVLNDGKRTEVRSIGDAVAGGTLTKIEKDRVVIERAGSAAEVLLRASIQAVGSPGARGAARPGIPAGESPEDDGIAGETSDGVSAPERTAPPIVQPSQTTPEAANKAALQQRWAERMQQLRERRKQEGPQ